METMHRRWAVRRGSGIMERRSPSILTLSPWRGRMGMLLLAIGFLISLVGVHQEPDRLVEGKIILEFKCRPFSCPSPPNAWTFCCVKPFLPTAPSGRNSPVFPRR